MAQDELIWPTIYDHWAEITSNQEFNNLSTSSQLGSGAVGAHCHSSITSNSGTHLFRQRNCLTGRNTISLVRQVGIVEVWGKPEAKKAFLPTPVMAKLKRQNNSSKDCEVFRLSDKLSSTVRLAQIAKARRQSRPLRKQGKSVEENITLKSVSLLLYWLLITDWSRARRKSGRRIAYVSLKEGAAETRHQASELTAAELAASETLAQMQVDRAIQEKGGILGAGAHGENEEAAVDREWVLKITALWEEGERQQELESEDEESDNCG
ncbi:hypothetical protein R3P38DRAFT_2765191 [Favolaschia claudopus]|uniref:Uncharacterized protein n=1 Tax=Favolaschia claudopus TaxID=2862362 RepID=A0AAW0D5F7_9AGAR